MRYTIKQFQTQFPTDKACMAHIFKQRFPYGYKCLKCGKDAFHPVKNRRSYACSCGFQVYPTEGTIFHKSSTSLVLWFYASLILCLAILKYSLSLSIPIKLRFRFLAATPVEPEPIVKSNTVSFSSV